MSKPATSMSTPVFRLVSVQRANLLPKPDGWERVDFSNDKQYLTLTNFSTGGSGTNVEDDHGSEDVSGRKVLVMAKARLEEPVQTSLRDELGISDTTTLPRVETSQDSLQKFFFIPSSTHIGSNAISDGHIGSDDRLEVGWYTVHNAALDTQYALERLNNDTRRNHQNPDTDVKGALAFTPFALREPKQSQRWYISIADTFPFPMSSRVADSTSTPPQIPTTSSTPSQTRAEVPVYTISSSPDIISNTTERIGAPSLAKLDVLHDDTDRVVCRQIIGSPMGDDGKYIVEGTGWYFEKAGEL